MKKFIKGSDIASFLEIESGFDGFVALSELVKWLVPSKLIELLDSVYIYTEEEIADQHNFEQS